MADLLLPGFDARFLPRAKREETIAEIPSRVLFVGQGSSIQLLLLNDGTLEKDVSLTIGEALFILQIKKSELRQGWYNPETREFLGAKLPEKFLEAR